MAGARFLTKGNVGLERHAVVIEDSQVRTVAIQLDDECGIRFRYELFVRCTVTLIVNDATYSGFH
jgi:hypothetical protein